jgi:hypothetical protein
LVRILTLLMCFSLNVTIEIEYAYQDKYMYNPN